MQELKEYRKRHGLSQKELSQFLRVNQGSVSFWENGEIKPSGPASLLVEILIKMDAHPNNIFVSTKKTLFVEAAQ